ncbi:galactocerebrosidase isoform X2 [Biomphalaria glabrata]|nr:galactocerebrosidase isoform X2 [Biomphalaria glabrata]
MNSMTSLAHRNKHITITSLRSRLRPVSSFLIVYPVLLKDLFVPSLSWGCTATGNTAFLTYLGTYYKASIIQGHMILWRLTSLEKVFGPLKITVHVMLQKEEDAGPGVEDSLLPSPNLPQGSFAKLTSMNVWYSKIGLMVNLTLWFIHLGQLMFVSDQAVLKLGLDEVYKLTIISTGQKRILYRFTAAGVNNA